MSDVAFTLIAISGLLNSFCIIGLGVVQLSLIKRIEHLYEKQ